MTPDMIFTAGFALGLAFGVIAMGGFIYYYKVFDIKKRNASRDGDDIK